MAWTLPAQKTPFQGSLEDNRQRRQLSDESPVLLYKKRRKTGDFAGTITLLALLELNFQVHFAIEASIAR